MLHHDEAVRRYLARTTGRPEVLGVLLTGSLARGTERPTSDVDLVLIVTDDAWQEALAADAIMVVEQDGAEYPDGYFDVKLATLEQLRAAASRGDDPARSSLGDAKVLHDQGFGLAGMLRAIDGAARVDPADAARSFLAQARLHGEYFLEQGIAKADPFLTAHAAVHLGLAVGRLLLALAGTPHPGPKDLVAAVADLPEPGPAVASAIRAVAAAPTAEHGRALLDLAEQRAGHLLSPGATLSRYILDAELAWFSGVPHPEHR